MSSFGDVQWKEPILGILTVAAGLLNAYLWKGVMYAGELKGISFDSLPVVSLFLFAILFALSAAFIRNWYLRTGAAVLCLAGGYAFVSPTSAVMVGAPLSALAGWYAASAISGEYDASRMFHVRKVLRGGLPVFFTGLALVLAVFYYATVGSVGVNVFIPRALFNLILPLIESQLPVITPAGRSGLTSEGLLLAFAAGQLPIELQNLLGEFTRGGLTIESIPSPVREELIREGRRVLAEEFGLKLTGQEPPAEILYRLTNEQISRALGPYRGYLPLAAAAAFFIAVKTLTIPIYWITLILVFGVVELLIALGVLKRETLVLEAERITL